VRDGMQIIKAGIDAGASIKMLDRELCVTACKSGYTTKGARDRP
jgi:hypothetical protein